MLKGAGVWCASSLLLGEFLPYFGTVSGQDRFGRYDRTKEAAMAKSSTGRTKSGGGSSKATLDKIAKAAMSREMLAAGLTAAAAAIAASPKARKAIKDAGLDAADSASQAATTMMTNASKLGSLIAEAVADAAQRVLSGKWADDVGGTGVTATSKPVGRKAAPRKTGATRKAPATKAKTASKPKAKRPAAKAGTSAKRRSSAGARRRAPARSKTPPAI
jgi:hypothetical protein